MKFVLVGDTHVGLNKSSDLYHTVAFNLFSDIVSYCIKHKIKTVVHLGDFFHVRKELNTKTQRCAHQIGQLFEDNKIAMYLITGNHDIYYKDVLVPSTLELFEKYEYVSVVDEPTEINKDIILSPWGIVPESAKKWLFGHYAILGFKMNNSFECDKGYKPADFKKFEHVWSGHFHTPSSRENITYVGTPYPMTFHDVNSTRGYYIWEDGETEFIEFDKAPKFILIETDALPAKKDALKIVNGNIVKLIFKEDYGSVKNQKIIDDMLSHNPIRLSTNFSKIQIEYTDEDRPADEQQQIGLLDHSEIISEYVRETKFPDNIKPNILLKMIDELRENT